MSSVDYCAIPAAPAPQGQSSNLIDPNDLSYETLTTGAVLTGISLAFLVGRLLINRKRMALADCKYYSPDPTHQLKRQNTTERRYVSYDLCDSNFLCRLIYCRVRI